MKIDQTQALINSQSITRVERQDSSQPRFWLGERPQFELPDLNDGGTSTSVSDEAAPVHISSSTVLTFDQFDISKQGLQVSYSLSNNSANGVPGEVSYEISNEDQIQFKMIENFMRRLTGKEINLHMPIKIKIHHVPLTEATESNKGWRLEIDFNLDSEGSNGVSVTENSQSGAKHQLDMVL